MWDVSEEGMGDMVSGELEQGEFVQLRFSLASSSHVLELRARVCDQRGYYCGFEFLVVSDAQREHIKLACEELPPRRVRKAREIHKRAATASELFSSRVAVGLTGGIAVAPPENPARRRSSSDIPVRYEE